MTKQEILTTALRIVRRFVDSRAEIAGNVVRYTHYRGERGPGGVFVRTTRNLSFQQCKQLVEDLS